MINIDPEKPSGIDTSTHMNKSRFFLNVFRIRRMIVLRVSHAKRSIFVKRPFSWTIPSVASPIGSLFADAFPPVRVIVQYDEKLPERVFYESVIFRFRSCF